MSGLEAPVTSPIQLIAVGCSVELLGLLRWLLLGVDDALTLDRVVHWPEVAVISLLDDALIHKIGELSFKLGMVDLLLLLLCQLLLHLRELLQLGLGVTLFLLLRRFFLLNLSLGSAANTAGLYQVSGDALARLNGKTD